MKRIAIVVQRCHESVVGGAEALAWQYVKMLRDVADVEVLTTTAVDAVTWDNALPEGAHERDGITVRRFQVTIKRSQYWYALDMRLRAVVEAGLQEGSFKPADIVPWRLSLQEEYIRQQGPYSYPLLRFLEQETDSFDSLIFLTYLYPTTYFGLQVVNGDRVSLVPTLHDEPPAYLKVFGYAARGARQILWNTDAERRLAAHLWGRSLPGPIISMGIDTRQREPAQLGFPFILYCGRIDPHKGCPELIDHFVRYKRENGGNLHLVLTGKKELEIPSRDDIRFLGFVPDEEKLRLMAGARAFAMPSPYESLSVVTLEAMAQGTPVLGAAACEVIRDHLGDNERGWLYGDYDSFARGLGELAREGTTRQSICAAGQAYVKNHYEYNVVRDKLRNAVNVSPDKH